LGRAAKERTPEGPNGDGNDDNNGNEGDDNGGGDDGGDDGGDNGDDETFRLHRCVVELAVNPSRIYTRRSTNVSKPWKR
jgi:hypothetical protein